MPENTDIELINEDTLRNKIYVIRGQKVMLDRDLAEIYGYSTKRFNEQVKRNRSKFDESFIFQLTWKETAQYSRSQNATMKNSRIRGENIKYLPYAFTEQGIYMLMTVLKGELATKQSIALIKLFKQMKDYIVSEKLLEPTRLLKLYEAITDNTAEIKQIQNIINTDLVSKTNLQDFMVNFTDEHLGRELLLLDGQWLEAKIVYEKILSHAKHTIYLVDNYISIETLLLFKSMSSNVVITIFSNNTGNQLREKDIQTFRKQYPAVNLEIQKVDKSIHDRYIIIDYNTETEISYHCGASPKEGGKKISSITRLYDRETVTLIVEKLLAPNIPTLN